MENAYKHRSAEAAGEPEPFSDDDLMAPLRSYEQSRVSQLANLTETVRKKHTYKGTAKTTPK
jgi:hypothetical protein